VILRRGQVAALFQEAAALLGWHGSARHLVSLGAGDGGIGTRGQIDGATLRELSRLQGDFIRSRSNYCALISNSS